MLNINSADVEQIVEIMEYILDNEGTVTVDKLMKDCHLTFEEYRLMSALSMPAIRRKNEMSALRSRAKYYKAAYILLKAEWDRLNDALNLAKVYLDKHFTEKPKIVIKTVEQEAEENGEGDDTDSTEEPDNIDR